jgi:hypothetical protein
MCPVKYELGFYIPQGGILFLQILFLSHVCLTHRSVQNSKREQYHQTTEAEETV